MTRNKEIQDLINNFILKESKKETLVEEESLVEEETLVKEEIEDGKIDICKVNEMIEEFEKMNEDLCLICLNHEKKNEKFVEIVKN